MFPNQLSPGNIYRLSTGYRVQYIGANAGINLETGNKIKVSRKNVAVRIVHRDWLRGCAESSGCAVLDTPSGGLHVTGPEAKLRHVAEIIGETHRFYPPTNLGDYVDGKLRTDLGPYPRIEIHPQMVYERH